MNRMQYPIPRPRGLLTLALAALLALLAPWASAEEDKKDYSVAERLIFMTDQLRNVKPPATLRYSFHRSGALEEGFDDTVTMSVTPQPDGSCCAGHGDFLTGTRRVAIPDVEGATGNPVTVYFLERDVREMNRLTKGSQSYFRKLIRMAIYQGATVKSVSLPYQGRLLAGHEVTVTPFLDDPMRARYDKFARKTYSFLLSDDVPGGVYGIKTRMAAEKQDAAPLIVEEMLIDGADTANAKTTP